MAQTLTHSQATILRQLIVDLGLGTDAGDWPVAARQELDTPDDTITVYNRPGKGGGERLMNDGSNASFYGFQVRVRSTSPDSGYTKADAIYTDLSTGVYDRVVSVDSSRYLVHSIDRIGDVLDLGKDRPNTNRHLHVFDGAVSVKQVS